MTLLDSSSPSRAPRRTAQVGPPESRPLSSPSGYGSAASSSPRHKGTGPAFAGRPASDITTGRSSPRVVMPPGLSPSSSPRSSSTTSSSATTSSPSGLSRGPPPTLVPRKSVAPAHEYNERHKVQALRIQTRVRAWLARKQANELRQRRFHRRKVVEEILSTEKTYLETLSIITDRYIHPLRTAARPILSENELKIVFSSIEVILNTNTKLYEDLQKEVAAYDPTKTMLGHVFLHMTAYLKVYTDYVSNYPNALTCVHDLLETNSVFASHCERVMQTTGSDLDSLLITPVQRIPRYQMLLRDLVKDTEEEHLDFKDLCEALKKVTSVAELLNERRRAAENLSSVLKVQHNLVGKFPSLVNAQRRYLTEGSLTVINPKTGKGKLRHVFVFNDLVVLSKLPKKAGGKFSYESQVRLHNPLGPADVVEYEGKFSKSLPHAFELVTPSAQLLLSVPDEEQRHTWLCVLNDAIEELQIQKAYFEKQKEKVAQENAKAAKAMLAQQYATLRMRAHTESQSSQSLVSPSDLQELADRPSGEASGDRPRIRSFRVAQQDAYSFKSALERMEAGEKAAVDLKHLQEEERKIKAEFDAQRQKKAKAAKEQIEQKYTSLRQRRESGSYRRT